MGRAVADFYVFKNAKTNKVNVVYKRGSGGVGLIEPEALTHPPRERPGHRVQVSVVVASGAGAFEIGERVYFL